MRMPSIRVRTFAGIVALILPLSVSAEVLDRIAVTVGPRVISESELVREIRLSAFLDGRSPDLSGSSKRLAAQRMVDQYLILQDAALTRATLPASTDGNSLLIPIRARYASQDEYLDALRRAGITEADLGTHLSAGLRMLRYTDMRFRPEVQISEEDLRALYESLPETERRAKSLEQSRPALEQVLAGERVMRALDRWLDMVRQDVAIVYREAAFE